MLSPVQKYTYVNYTFGATLFLLEGLHPGRLVCKLKSLKKKKRSNWGTVWTLLPHNNLVYNWATCTTKHNMLNPALIYYWNTKHLHLNYIYIYGI